MRIRKAAVPFRGQAPEAFRATDLSRPVIKGDETLGVQLGKVLTNANHGDANDTRQRASRQWAARLKDVEEFAVVIRRHLAAKLRKETISQLGHYKTS